MYFTYFKKMFKKEKKNFNLDFIKNPKPMNYKIFKKSIRTEENRISLLYLNISNN